MLERIKTIGSGVLVLICGVVFVLVIAFVVGGGIKILLNHEAVLNFIDVLVIGTILLMFVLSIIPKLRIFTGTVIVYAATIWIFLLWLTCLVITFQIWGSIGAFIGLVMAGAGIFFTAIIASFFSGQWVGALILIFTLFVMFGVRFLGAWIAGAARITKFRKEYE